ncbi:MAG: amidohydrolase family protein [Trueperaceae bacterium]|nr:amidohydrolase family protein [Trueperaceae bacterium]MCC6311796.1 amidohydrolase family protein [Trueperaceae bacterium]
MPDDLIVRNAQLRQRAGLVDIGVADGVITAIEPRITGAGRREIDAAGRLVTEPLVDCHFHIDKSFFGEVTGRYDYPLKEREAKAAASFEGEPRSGMLDYEMSHENVVPIEETWAFKRTYTVDDVAQRIGRALDLAISYGTLAMRMFVDVDSFAGLTALEGAVKARERYGATMDLQICAFPQEGLRTNEESFELMERALVSGADVVGGLPWVEWTDAAASAHIDFCFELAKRFDKDVHFLCDDAPDPMSRTLEMVAAKTIATGFNGRVSSSHNGALRHYPDAHAVRVINMLKQAGVNMVANANVNSLGTYTRVPELLAAGVNVSFGQDDLDNFYYPLGRADMLDVMNFTVHMAHLATPRGFETAFDIGTFNGARTLRLGRYGIAVGNPANMLVFAGHNAHQVLQMQSDRNYVISKGQVVCETNRTSALQLIGAR